MPYDPEQITFFAKADARGQNVPFGIKAKDRTRHVYVIGKTGMGKSTLLENMAVQDMQHGNGLAFIDPHGATAETLLQYVPEDRVDDVLYFAPFDTQHPIAFNVMEDVGPEKRHLVAAGLMSVFKKIWVDAWSARMEYILQNTLLALLEYPDSTLLGVNRMLSEKFYRKAVIDNISDPAVKSFWVDEFLNYNERYMQEAGDAIKNKIGQFTANPLIRNIIGQPHTSFDLRKMMDEKKILIANLSKGLIGEGNANLLGSMLTTRIYLAAMSRADLEPQAMKQMPNYYFYVDEFQSFANATFADILSEARKYHLNLTIAHQYVEQMEEEVRNAVFGNVGTMISFRVGPFDAEVLETIFAPQFYAVDIVNLGFAQVYLSLMIDGIGSRPFSAVTLPPIEPPRVSCRDMVVARSRERFGSERAAVENNVNSWMAESYKPNANHDSNDRKGKPATKNAAPPNRKQPAKGGETQRATEPKLKPTRTKSDHHEQDNGSNKKADLNELRSVLKNLAADTTHTPPPKKSDQPAASPATPAPNAERKNPTTQTSKQAPTTRSQTEAPTAPAAAVSGESLKDALAAVLAERENTKQSTTATTDTHASKAPAQAAPTQKPKTNTKPKPRTTTTATATPAPDEPPKSTKHAETAAPSTHHDDAAMTHSEEQQGLDPKAIERMLRVTGADNSPFKKR